jgi:membrane fusion protein, multidrug efflux system
MFRSLFVAILIAASVSIWILSGQWGESKAEAEEIKTPAKLSEGAATASVRVKAVKSEPFVAKLELAGQTKAFRTVQVKSELAGSITKMNIDRGTIVETVDLIVRFSDDERPALLAEAKAALQQAKADYNANEALVEKGFASKNKLESFAAAVARAEAGVTQATLAVKDLDLLAPFSGVINETYVELGSFVSKGEPIATLVQLDPMLAAAQVSERDMSAISVGAKVNVKLIDERSIKGEVSFISKIADPNTRTFEIEVLIPNPNGEIGDGLTAIVGVPKGAVMAHFIPSSVLSLNDQGIIGVKYVTDEGIVVFSEIVIIQSEADGIWVGGLPDEITLITVGQEFVQDGQLVNTVDEELLKSKAQAQN